MNALAKVKEYWKNPKATAKVMHDEWIGKVKIAQQDGRFYLQDGRFYLFDRKTI